MARSRTIVGMRRVAKTVVSAVGKRLPVVLTTARAAVLAFRSRQYRSLQDAHPVEESVAIFDSFGGRGYSCSPRALYRAMLRDDRYGDVEKIWVLRGPVVRALAERGGYDVRGLDDMLSGAAVADDLEMRFSPEALDELRGAVIVAWGSPEFRRSYARAALWVTNSVLPAYLTPRAGQSYVQTWHGTPLKRLGCDILPEVSRNAMYSAEDMHRRYSHEGARLTWLLSPSRYASERFASAFDLVSTGRAAAILEEGYPRNDYLSTFEPGDAERIRERLGVPPGKKVLLYAPTWRDNQHTSGVGYTYETQADFEALRSALGDDYVVLFRAHYFVASSFDFAALDGFVIDVSKTDDINELYVASDLLVTDYSSVFFDYANLGRPIVFFMYDLEYYASELRGFYLDVDELPGPVVRTTERLIEAVRASERPTEHDGERLAGFRARFTYLDDGHASERVLARVFPPPVGNAPALRTLDRTHVVAPSDIRALKRRVKRVVTAIGKRSARFRKVYRGALKRKRDRNYRSHYADNAVMDDVIVFECFQGRAYTCSPKALYLTMRKDPRFEGFTFVWAFKHPSRYLDEPEMRGAELVRYQSQAYYRTYAHAKYWVTNSRLPDQIEPKPEQVYVQTWHGTPLKRIGCDLAKSSNALYSADQIFRQYSREGERITLLLSPSGFASEKFISGFNLNGLGREEVILEEGYPRNDFLCTFTTADVSRIRAELGLPAGKKVVLYAPTWREDQHTSGVGYTYDVAADFEMMQRDLGDEYVILFRAHYFVANAFDFDRYRGFVIDVSGVDDINDLYVVSDVLITDYSSVFFDYANLGRPIIFYMYDLEAYANDLRGFYLDLDQLPGPIVRTEQELVAALVASSGADPALAERYARFRERFTYLDDGHASERVIERMLTAGGSCPSADDAGE